MAVQYCVICGRGSDRTWNNTLTVGATTYVACDFHSWPDFQGAVSNLSKAPGPGDTNQGPSIDESQGV